MLGIAETPLSTDSFISVASLQEATRSDAALRWGLVAGLLVVLPIAAYHRIKAHRSDDPLDRTQEGLFILMTLRPIAAVFVTSVGIYLVNPARMAWSMIELPLWMRWAGVATFPVIGALLFWTLHRLGPNLTDTVVTRKVHALVINGPYRWVRHPFYDTVAALLMAVALVAANWFMFVTGVTLFILFAIRAPREEQRLVARFGDAYRGYMARTNRFIPTVRSSGK